MSAKYRTTKDDFPKVEKSLKPLNGKKVNVGVLGGEAQYYASIMEYGCKIPVTPKMRVWLHAHGLHLKESTNTITTN